MALISLEQCMFICSKLIEHEWIDQSNAFTMLDAAV